MQLHCACVCARVFPNPFDVVNNKFQRMCGFYCETQHLRSAMATEFDKTDARDAKIFSMPSNLESTNSVLCIYHDVANDGNINLVVVFWKFFGAKCKESLIHDAIWNPFCIARSVAFRCVMRYRAWHSVSIVPENVSHFHVTSLRRRHFEYSASHIICHTKAMKSITHTARQSQCVHLNVELLFK